MITGQVGVELSVEEASQAAQMVGLNMLASLRAEIDGLDKIERVYKVLGMVNAGPGFDQHPAVINGCSQLFLDVFGQDRGVGTRSAFGVSGLPGNAAVEIEGVFVLK
jgi:enamine deaminase RidA (YjgF/YER057c/UK114 family)